jgi:hypothetical protein
VEPVTIGAISEKTKDVGKDLEWASTVVPSPIYETPEFTVGFTKANEVEETVLVSDVRGSEQLQVSETAVYETSMSVSGKGFVYEEGDMFFRKVVSVEADSVAKELATKTDTEYQADILLAESLEPRLLESTDESVKDIFTVEVLEDVFDGVESLSSDVEAEKMSVIAESKTVEASSKSGSPFTEGEQELQLLPHGKETRKEKEPVTTEDTSESIEEIDKILKGTWKEEPSALCETPGVTFGFAKAIDVEATVQRINVTASEEVEVAETALKEISLSVSERVFVDEENGDAFFRKEVTEEADTVAEEIATEGIVTEGENFLERLRFVTEHAKEQEPLRFENITERTVHEWKADECMLKEEPHFSKVGSSRVSEDTVWKRDSKIPGEVDISEAPILGISVTVPEKVIVLEGRGQALFGSEDPEKGKLVLKEVEEESDTTKEAEIFYVGGHGPPSRDSISETSKEISSEIIERASDAVEALSRDPKPQSMSLIDERKVLDTISKGEDKKLFMEYVAGREEEQVLQIVPSGKELIKEEKPVTSEVISETVVHADKVPEATLKKQPTPISESSEFTVHGEKSIETEEILEKTDVVLAVELKLSKAADAEITGTVFKKVVVEKAEGFILLEDVAIEQEDSVAMDVERKSGTEEDDNISLGLQATPSIGSTFDISREISVGQIMLDGVHDVTSEPSEIQTQGGILPVEKEGVQAASVDKPWESVLEVVVTELGTFREESGSGRKYGKEDEKVASDFISDTTESEGKIIEATLQQPPPPTEGEERDRATVTSIYVEDITDKGDILTCVKLDETDAAVTRSSVSISENVLAAEEAQADTLMRTDMIGEKGRPAKDVETKSDTEEGAENLSADVEELPVEDWTSQRVKDVLGGEMLDEGFVEFEVVSRTLRPEGQAVIPQRERVEAGTGDDIYESHIEEEIVTEEENVLEGQHSGKETEKEPQPFTKEDVSEEGVREWKAVEHTLKEEGRVHHFAMSAESEESPSKRDINISVGMEFSEPPVTGITVMVSEKSLVCEEREGHAFFTREVPCEERLVAKEVESKSYTTEEAKILSVECHETPSVGSTAQMAKKVFAGEMLEDASDVVEALPTCLHPQDVSLVGERKSAEISSEGKSLISFMEDGSVTEKEEMLEMCSGNEPTKEQETVISEYISETTVHVCKEFEATLKKEPTALSETTVFTHFAEKIETEEILERKGIVLPVKMKFSEAPVSEISDTVCKVVVGREAEEIILLGKEDIDEGESVAMDDEIKSGTEDENENISVDVQKSVSLGSTDQTVGEISSGKIMLRGVHEMQEESSQLRTQGDVLPGQRETFEFGSVDESWESVMEDDSREKQEVLQKWPSRIEHAKEQGPVVSELTSATTVCEWKAVEGIVKESEPASVPGECRRDVATLIDTEEIREKGKVTTSDMSNVSETPVTLPSSMECEQFVVDMEGGGDSFVKTDIIQQEEFYAKGEEIKSYTVNTGDIVPVGVQELPSKESTVHRVKDISGGKMLEPGVHEIEEVSKDLRLQEKTLLAEIEAVERTLGDISFESHTLDGIVLEKEDVLERLSSAEETVKQQEPVTDDDISDTSVHKWNAAEQALKEELLSSDVMKSIEMDDIAEKSYSTLSGQMEVTEAPVEGVSVLVSERVFVHEEGRRDASFRSEVGEEGKFLAKEVETVSDTVKHDEILSVDREGLERLVPGGKILKKEEPGTADKDMEVYEEIQKEENTVLTGGTVVFERDRSEQTPTVITPGNESREIYPILLEQKHVQVEKMETLWVESQGQTTHAVEVDEIFEKAENELLETGDVVDMTDRSPTKLTTGKLEDEVKHEEGKEQQAASGAVAVEEFLVVTIEGDETDVAAALRRNAEIHAVEDFGGILEQKEFEMERSEEADTDKADVMKHSEAGTKPKVKAFIEMASVNMPVEEEAPELQHAEVEMEGRLVTEGEEGIIIRASMFARDENFELDTKESEVDESAAGRDAIKLASKEQPIKMEKECHIDEEDLSEGRETKHSTKETEPPDSEAKKIVLQQEKVATDKDGAVHEARDMSQHVSEFILPEGEGTLDLKEASASMFDAEDESAQFVGLSSTFYSTDDQISGSITDSQSTNDRLPLLLSKESQCEDAPVILRGEKEVISDPEPDKIVVTKESELVGGRFEKYIGGFDIEGDRAKETGFEKPEVPLSEDAESGLRSDTVSAVPSLSSPSSSTSKYISDASEEQGHATRKLRKQRLLIETHVTETEVKELMSEVREVTRQIKQEVRELKPDLTPTPEGKESSILPPSESREFVELTDLGCIKEEQIVVDFEEERPQQVFLSYERDDTFSGTLSLDVNLADHGEIENDLVPHSDAIALQVNAGVVVDEQSDIVNTVSDLKAIQIMPQETEIQQKLDAEEFYLSGGSIAAISGAGDAISEPLTQQIPGRDRTAEIMEEADILEEEIRDVSDTFMEPDQVTSGETYFEKDKSLGIHTLDKHRLTEDKFDELPLLEGDTGRLKGEFGESVRSVSDTQKTALSSKDVSVENLLHDVDVAKKDFHIKDSEDECSYLRTAEEEALSGGIAADVEDGMVQKPQSPDPDVSVRLTSSGAEETVSSVDSQATYTETELSAGGHLQATEPLLSADKDAADGPICHTTVEERRKLEGIEPPPTEKDVTSIVQEVFLDELVSVVEESFSVLDVSSPDNITTHLVSEPELGTWSQQEDSWKTSREEKIEGPVETSAWKTQLDSRFEMSADDIVMKDDLLEVTVTSEETESIGAKGKLFTTEFGSTYIEFETGSTHSICVCEDIVSSQPVTLHDPDRSVGHHPRKVRDDAVHHESAVSKDSIKTGSKKKRAEKQVQRESTGKKAGRELVGVTSTKTLDDQKTITRRSKEPDKVPQVSTASASGTPSRYRGYMASTLSRDLKVERSVADRSLQFNRDTSVKKRVTAEREYSPSTTSPSKPPVPKQISTGAVPKSPQMMAKPRRVESRSTSTEKEVQETAIRKQVSISKHSKPTTTATTRSVSTREDKLGSSRLTSASVSDSTVRQRATSSSDSSSFSLRQSRLHSTVKKTRAESDATQERGRNRKREDQSKLVHTKTSDKGKDRKKAASGPGTGERLSQPIADSKVKAKFKESASELESSCDIESGSVLKATVPSKQVTKIDGTMEVPAESSAVIPVPAEHAITTSHITDSKDIPTSHALSPSAAPSPESSPSIKSVLDKSSVMTSGRKSSRATSPSPSASPVRAATSASRSTERFDYSTHTPPSLPSSPSRMVRQTTSQLGVTQLLTSEVFTRTVDTCGSIEVIYRQPTSCEPVRRIAVVSGTRSSHDTVPSVSSAVAEGEVSLIDTTDSSLSDSVALPSSSSDHDLSVDTRLRTGGSPASPKPTRRSLDIIHDGSGPKLRISDLSLDYSAVPAVAESEHLGSGFSVPRLEGSSSIVPPDAVPRTWNSIQISEERLSPILDVHAVTPPRVKHKFQYEDDGEEEEAVGVILSSPGKTDHLSSAPTFNLTLAAAASVQSMASELELLLQEVQRSMRLGDQWGSESVKLRIENLHSQTRLLEQFVNIELCGGKFHAGGRKKYDGIDGLERTVPESRAIMCSAQRDVTALSDSYSVPASLSVHSDSRIIWDQYLEDCPV